MSREEKEYLIEIVETEKKNLIDITRGGELTLKGQKCLGMIDNILQELKTAEHT